ncbi:thioester domain-containing protein [Spirilliplanes yamanashiensis]|uniref:TQXA domain-containing protein n=1 Tax=Spirilliplanes yamanashiensis TaxID=42233 RepID=A0A8J4DKE8_9ACTN|nr:thioester domain-containing protein [Spirilliplanes yamanashiensis]MDP9815971.1 LPXTG-motif cell wall-anchored protein [Spirilliplanes yamanashiensis]GIJ04228.1 hypothetical protein Sya03_35800 [Spirilliplanes yamanashiensis]
MAVLAGVVIGLVGATPALADPVVAVPEGGKSYGQVRLEKAGDNRIGYTQIHPMWLKLGNERAVTYCIDLHHPVALGKDYEEGTWSEAEVKNLAKVQWVLLHGYQGADDNAKLLADAGATTEGEQLGAKRVKELLYLATQVTVWHFSDDANLAGNGREGEGRLRQNEYRLVAKVYGFLKTNATDQPEPKTELKIDPASAASVEAGQKAGPFTVTGPSGDIPLTVTGGTAVDAAGDPVTSVTNGGQFWLTRDTPGEVTVAAKAQASHSTGRVFLFKGGKQAKRQKLILAGQIGEELTAGAKAAFTPKPETTPSPTPSVTSPSPSPSVTSPAPSTPAPSPSVPGEGGGDGGELPQTGASLYGAIIGGVLLLAAGVAALIVVRRRKVRFTA